MYAIVDISGQQFKVTKNQRVFVNRLNEKQGSEICFDKVILLEHDNKVSIGTPTIEGALVRARILNHIKSNKVIVFKKKRRKGYRVKNGHRQCLTQIHIENITV